MQNVYLIECADGRLVHDYTTLKDTIDVSFTKDLNYGMRFHSMKEVELIQAFLEVTHNLKSEVLILTESHH